MKCCQMDTRFGADLKNGSRGEHKITPIRDRCNFVVDDHHPRHSTKIPSPGSKMRGGIFKLSVGGMYVLPVTGCLHVHAF